MFLWLALSISFSPLSPTADVLAALADARRLGAVAARTRYLSLAAVPDADRERWVNVLHFWANSLSREGDVSRLRRVSPTLLAVVLDQFGWDANTWEKLAAEDPYYHVQIVQEVLQWPGGTWPGDGRHYAAGSFTYFSGKQLKQTALAPWLPTAETAELVRLTGSQVPIVRGDWWFSRSAIQVGRQGTGYYDWLAIKNRQDFEKLVHLDVEASKRIKREVAAIVSRSGVSQHPRQIVRFQALTGGAYVTLDVITDNLNTRNPLRQLDDQFQHEAEEHYAPLANGLFAYFLCNANGQR